MPEQEFEIYLSLLSRLLRLSPAQKAAISDELRDHLEQRLSDLVQSGMTREVAIQKAMEEFGDVTGLALDLTRVSRTPLRKVVVRSTIVASMTAVAIVCWVSFFAPDHRVVAPQPVQAQSSPQAQEIPRASQALVLVDEDLFPAFLTKQTDVDLADVSLKDVCELLNSMHDIPVMLARPALQDEGISDDQPVTLKLKGLTFEEVLNHLTRQLHLTWQVDGGVVRITTLEAAQYLTRHFDLQELTKRGHALGSLMTIVRMAANGWEEEGSYGTIAVIGDSVVVRQTYLNQRRIAQVLAAIQLQQPMTVIGTCTGRDALMEALQERRDISFADVPLADVMAILSERHKLTIMFDTSAMTDESISPDQPVTLAIKNRPLGKQLELLLADYQLTYQVRDGVIRITTTTKAGEDMMWVVYNVQDLAPYDELVNQLSLAIQRTTSGEWEDIQNQGGKLTQTNVEGRLVVEQTEQVHHEIQTLLDQLRRSRKGRAVDPDKAARPKMVTKMYRMPKEVASDLHTSLKNMVSPESWVAVNGETPTIEVVASSPQMESVNGLVTGGGHEIQVVNHPQGAGVAKAGTIPAQPQPVADSTIQSVVVRPRSTLVIRQTPEVHREIQKFLLNLNVPYEPVGLGGGGGGGMGGGMGGGGLF